MSKRSRTKLVPLKPDLGDQALYIFEEPNPVEQNEEPIVTELDLETECPRCHDPMELQSDFDKLMYCCDNCNFILKCI